MKYVIVFSLVLLTSHVAFAKKTSRENGSIQKVNLVDASYQFDQTN